MRRLETMELWDELVELKDELSLRELSARFGVTPGAISAALKRSGITRQPAPPGPRSGRKARNPGHPSGPAVGAKGPEHEAKVRPGSKDHLIERHHALLGEVPDAEVAKLAGVSVRTVASFRARHDIPGYSGPRRASTRSRKRQSKIDPFAHLLGQVPDRVVAEKAGVSLNAVRNYRVKRGIPAAGRAATAPVEAAPASPDVAPAVARTAWRVSIRHDGAVVEGVVLAPSVEAAAQLAADAARTRYAGGTVQRVEWVGELL